MSEDAPKESGLESVPHVAAGAGVAPAGAGPVQFLTPPARKLLVSGEFTNLRVLVLNNNPVGNEGAEAIARSPHLAGLLVLA